MEDCRRSFAIKSAQHVVTDDDGRKRVDGSSQCLKQDDVSRVA